MSLIIGFTDDFVLYCDVDAIFIRDVGLSDFEFGPNRQLPQYYLAGCEDCTSDHNSKLINAGVMLYNIGGMQWTYDAFISHVFSEKSIKDGLHFGEYGPGDQGKPGRALISTHLYSNRTLSKAQLCF